MKNIFTGFFYVKNNVYIYNIKIKHIMTTLASLVTSDFQKRGDNYPKSGKPDSIDTYGLKNEHLQFVFKNTDEKTGKEWVKKYLASKGLTTKKIGSEQTGDYKNDWIDVFAENVK